MGADIYLKELDAGLKNVMEKLRTELQAVRGNRPSVELVEEIKVNYYDQWMTVKQLGSLSISPPRDIHVNVWDKTAVGPVMKAIEAAKVGLTVTNDGNTIRASSSSLSNQRREELAKLVKKQGEAARIAVRTLRDETIKRAKVAAGTVDELTEDAMFKLKEKIQKAVDGANEQVEKTIGNKLQELAE